MWSASMRILVATAITALAIAPGAIDAAPCTTFKQNVLTSKDCPKKCNENACVFYSPAKKVCSAPECYVDPTYVPPGETDVCDLSYQCLDAVVDLKTQKWFLALEATKTKGVTYAPVTEVKDFKFPSVVRAVQLTAGVSKTAKGQVQNVIFDGSFFNTPPTVLLFFMTDLNLRNLLPKVTFSSSWEYLAFINANLDEVPEQVSKLKLKSLELSKNDITSIPDESTPVGKAIQSVTKLRLDDNKLTDFKLNLPFIDTLNLTGNSLSFIPEVIYQMKTLKTLSIRRCNLTNVQVTDAQFQFLDQLPTLDADLLVTKCASGYGPRDLGRGLGQVCLAGASAGTTDANAKADEGSSKSGLIIGLAVGGGVLVACAIAFVVYRRRKQVEYATNNTNTVGKGGNQSTLYDTGELTEGFLAGADTYGSSSIWSDPDLLAVRIEYRDIEPIKLLSRGGFGEVWLGLYMNENVAIKRLLADKKTMSDALAFAAEIKTMARLDHPKIVRFIGVAWTNALTIQAVTEFMDCGDLRSLLDSNRASSLTWANLKCQIAIDIADALVYLHTLNPKLIHRDLKSRNVLIDAHSGAKLSDFGISRNRSVEETMTAGVGTARWIAPEVILGGHYTEFADIYSFGVVLSELDTCRAPFHDATNTNGARMQDVTILQLVSAGKLQPSFTSSCPTAILKLARACMQFDPAQRPSAIHISYELRKILKDEL